MLIWFIFVCCLLLNVYHTHNGHHCVLHLIIVKESEITCTVEWRNTKIKLWVLYITRCQLFEEVLYFSRHLCRTNSCWLFYYEVYWCLINFFRRKFHFTLSHQFLTALVADSHAYPFLYLVDLLMTISFSSLVVTEKYGQLG